ncbi:MAG: hypothetical protein ABJA80_01990 [bacterium]
MTPRRHALVSTLLFAGACASAGGGPQSSPDRVVATDNGTPIRQMVNDDARVAVAAPRAKVWRALIGAYGDLGIVPTVADEATGTYGNRGFTFPARLHDRPGDDYFSCGSSLSSIGSSGRLVASVESQVTAVSDSESVVVTRASARYRSNAGTSSNALDCSTRGALEQYLQVDIKRRLAMAR